MIGQKDEKYKIFVADCLCPTNFVFCIFGACHSAEHYLSASSVDKTMLWVEGKLASFLSVLSTFRHTELAFQLRKLSVLSFFVVSFRT